MSVLLDTERPERLVDELPLEELVREVASIEDWTDNQIETVDYLLTNWTAQYTARTDEESVATLASAIAVICESPSLPEAESHRWGALDAVLESRRLELATRDPARVLGYRHVRAILDHLQQHGACTQAAILENLHLPITRSRLSQIINLMESHGLVTVRGRGRGQLVATPDSPFGLHHDDDRLEDIRERRHGTVAAGGSTRNYLRRVS